MKISLRSYYINKVGVDNISYDFFDILYNNKISYGKIISDKSHKINLMYQKGGSIHNADLNGITYQYHTSKIELIGNNHKKMDFLSIDGINNYCATLIYDKPEYGTTMVLNGIFNGEDCIKCMKSGIEYKVGDILMQIIINLVKEKPNFAHIKTIELKDNSIIKNGDIGIELIYLRTSSWARI